MLSTRLMSLSPALAVAVCLTGTAHAALVLNTVGDTTTVDFDNTVTGVNNGALGSGGTADYLTNPTAGHLDADGWAANMKSHTLPTSQVGNQEKPFGSAETGNDNLMRDATDTTGTGVGDGLNPTTFHGDGVGLLVDFGGNQFTPGSFFLLVENGTGQTISNTELTFDLWSAGNDGTSFELDLRYSTDGGTSFQSLGTAADNTVYTPNGSLQSIPVGTFTVPDAVNDGDTIIFAFDIDNPSGSSRDHAIIDNIAVTAIPEPASLALMGLGGLLVATGRRRKA